jgi:hypothetical protein
MRRIGVIAVMSAVLMAGLSLPSDASTRRSAGRSAASTLAALHHQRTCSAVDLQSDHLPRISTVTGQHPVAVRLTNASSSPCTLRGYPRPELLDARGRALPFLVANTLRATTAFD